MAPNRRRRPGSAFGLIEPPTDAELDECPFCEGREDRTPPETFRVPEGTSWRVRVVPNLFPAFERQEVVVHSPRHARSLAELEPHELEHVAAAWRNRHQAALADGFGYLHALVNEGRAAGASLAHSHSQLVWLREPPPEIHAEAAAGGCGVCELLEAAPSGKLLLGGEGGVVALVHPAGRLPYETLIAPRSHAGGGFGDLLGAGLRLLARAIRQLRAVEGPVPLNAWLHDGEHWHIELVPRLSVLAGVELGAGIYVNTVAPEEGAAALREVPI